MLLLSNAAASHALAIAAAAAAYVLANPPATVASHALAALRPMLLPLALATAVCSYCPYWVYLQHWIRRRVLPNHPSNQELDL